MLKIRSHLMIIVAAAGLAGCTFMDENLMPVLTGGEPSGEESASGQPATGYPPAQTPPSAAERNPQPILSPSQPPAVGAGNYSVAPVTPAANTGTYVGQKVTSLRGDLQRLQGSMNQHNQELQQLRQQLAQDAKVYYNLVAGINSRLQAGTTPGNPELVAQWGQAQSALDRLGDDVARLNALSISTAADRALAAYILEGVRAAYGLQGAIDEDHRQLKVIENDCNRTLQPIDRLIDDVNDEVGRQNNYVVNERRNLTVLSLAIKNGELYGQNLASRAAATSISQPSGAALGNRRPLVVIRFDRPNVAYEQPLYTAVSRALERRPSATFEVVAVAPTAGTPEQVALSTATSKKNADTVARSLTNMGLPADRIILSATTSASAQSNEVQIYVR